MRSLEALNQRTELASAERAAEEMTKETAEGSHDGESLLAMVEEGEEEAHDTSFLSVTGNARWP